MVLLAGSLADGCWLPYQPPRRTHRRRGEDAETDGIYTLSPKNIPVRRPETFSFRTDQKVSADRK